MAPIHAPSPLRLITQARRTIINVSRSLIQRFHSVKEAAAAASRPCPEAQAAPAPALALGEGAPDTKKRAVGIAPGSFLSLLLENSRRTFDDETAVAQSNTFILGEWPAAGGNRAGIPLGRRYLPAAAGAPLCSQLRVRARGLRAPGCVAAPSSVLLTHRPPPVSALRRPGLPPIHQLATRPPPTPWPTRSGPSLRTPACRCGCCRAAAPAKQSAPHAVSQHGSTHAVLQPWEDLPRRTRLHCCWQ
jgi:hypothetical protein